MSYRIDDDENRIQDLTDKIDQLEIQTFSPEVVARNESTRNTGVQTGDAAATNAYPQWMPIRDFGLIGNITLEILLNRVDSHVAKLTANGNIVFAFSVPPPTNKMMQFILDVTIDGTGGYTFEFGNTIIPAGITINNTAEARTVIRFTTTDGGDTYYAEDLTTGGGGAGDNLGDHIATQALQMQDNTIFLDTAQDQSIFALSLANNYVVPIGGAHDFFVNDLGTPKFGITETAIQSNVDLNMNSKNVIDINTLGFDVSPRLIKSDDTGISYETSALDDHTFRSPNGDFLALTEVNATDRRLDVKQNRVTNIGKLSFTGTFDLHTAGFSEIFQTLTDENIRYISKNAHIFEVDGQTQPLLTIGNFAGLGGALQDVASLNLTDSTLDPSLNGEFQMNGTTVKVVSDGIVRSFSDIIPGGGGSQTPWLQDIDADGFNLEDFGRTEYRTGLFGASVTPFSVFDGTNLRWHVPGSGDGFIWTIGAFEQIFGLGLSSVNVFKEMNMQSINKIINLDDPTSPQDAATKFYVDSQTANEGIQDTEIWLDHETDQFDFEVYHSNCKVGSQFTDTSVLTFEDFVVYVPIYVGKRTRLTEIGFMVAPTAPAGVYTVNVGIYDTYPDQNYPRTRLQEASGLFTGLDAKTISLIEDLEVGHYFLAILCTTDNLVTFGPSLSEALSVGYLLNPSSDRFFSTMGYLITGTSLPSTAADEMLPITTDVPPAVFAKFEFNPT